MAGAFGVVSQNKLLCQHQDHTDLLEVWESHCSPRRYNSVKCVFTLQRSSKYTKEKLIHLKSEINKPTVILDDINTLLGN